MNNWKLSFEHPPGFRMIHVFLLCMLHWLHETIAWLAKIIQFVRILNDVLCCYFSKMHNLGTWQFFLVTVHFVSVIPLLSFVTNYFVLVWTWYVPKVGRGWGDNGHCTCYLSGYSHLFRRYFCISTVHFYNFMTYGWFFIMFRPSPESATFVYASSIL